MVIWSEKNISWNDFTKVETKEKDYVATISYGIHCPNGLSWLDSKVFAYMNPYESEKLADSMLDDDVLSHEQYHFNITEYHARLLRRDIIKTGKKNISKSILDSLHAKYILENDLMQIKYDSITDHNLKTEEQRYWKLKLDDLLRKTSYYQEKDLLKYYAYSPGKTNYFRKIYRTFDHNILCSFPIYEEESYYGESYKVEKSKDSIVVSYYKNGSLFNGGLFDTAITLIHFKEELTQLKFLNPDKSFNDKIKYCIQKRHKENNDIVDYFFNNRNERISVDNVHYTISTVDANGIVHSKYFDKNDNWIKNETGIYQKKSHLDSLGRTFKLEYYDQNDNRMNDENFVSIVEIVLNNKNLTIGHKEFNQAGDYAKNLSSYNRKYEYDERGNRIKMINMDENSNISYDKYGIAIYTFNYDLYDNRVATKSFNHKNQPVQGTDDYHMYLKIFDSKGKNKFKGQYYNGHVLAFSEDKWGATKYLYPNDTLEIQQNVDVYDKVFNDNDGVGFLERYFDEQKNLKEIIYRDADSSFAKTEDGIVRYKYKHDLSGNKIEESAHDSIGNLVAFDEDVAIVRWEYDNNNNKIKTTYFNINDELADANQNVTHNIYKYNDKNQLMERSNLNKEGKPQLLDGYYKMKIIPNRFGSDSIILKYGTDNKLLPGLCKTIYEYDNYGNNITESFYNKDDKMTVNSNGIARIKYLYDKDLRYLGYSYFDTHGKPANNNIGISSYRLTLNNMGYNESESYYSKNGTPVKGSQGFHKKEYLWNDSGEVIEVRYLDTNNNLDEDRSGVAKYIYTRSAAGLISSIKRYNKTGKLTNDKSGVAETYYTPYMNGLYYLDKELDCLGNEIKDE
ncbi:hypothetical protein [Snuella sedimenti]|uniref:YD repeat-containing protein n=1 Tax=Snuella sedimenti TaxID=2798802 RepID=A0A8J7IW05_9FLAO|nr:hypothetical protein [Snuella sedimenti]MBJ6368035.1 hypothetical protein [Snuella sedimenti]